MGTKFSITGEASGILRSVPAALGRTTSPVQEMRGALQG